MSTLLEQASLVMIPSGYKEDVVYSQIPTNGNGDLSFTRASNGTRVNSAGLVEVCPWNLLQSTSDISTQSGYWASNQAATTNQNFAAAPNGTTTASKINATGIYLYEGVNQTGYTLVNQPYTYSVYLKTISGTITVKLLVLDNASTFHQIDVTVTTTWTRFELPFTPTAGSANVYLTSSQAGSWLAWGAQLNIGATAKPYFPTTDRLNVPRLTYQNGGGGCPSLLLEKQSTNLTTYSEDFANANWVATDASITTNAIISPDGTQNADKLSTNTTNNYHRIVANAQATATTAHTMSIFAKKGEYKYIGIAENNNDVGYGVFDLNAGTVLTSGSGATNVTIQNMGNGWYRCQLTFTAGAYSRFDIYAINDSYTSGNPAAYSFVGSSSNGLYIWGAQIEASSYPTSYIPTTSSSATRVADVCTKNGIGALIGGTSGTVFFDIKTNPVLSSASYKQFCYYFDSASAQSYMYLNSANQLSTNSNWGSFVFATPLVANTRYKIALVYAPNDFALYVNGVSVATASSGTPKDNADITIGQLAGTEYCEFVFNQYTHFPSRLTNAELASLTTI